MPRSELSSARIDDEASTTNVEGSEPRSLHPRASQRAAEAAFEMLDYLGPALIIMSESAALLWMNRKAERLLRDYQLSLSSMPCCEDGIQTAKHYDGSGRSVLIMAFPLERSPARVVVLAPFEPDRSEGPLPFFPRLLQDAFDLTPAEVTVAVSIASGRTLSETANELNVAESTVRSQIKSVFHKTGVRRQAELVRRIMSLQGFDRYLE